MSTILITGATGNCGFEIIQYFLHNQTSHQLVVGVRNIPKAQHLFTQFPDLHYAEFDFEDPTTFDKALSNIDRVFLLRPPHISDINTYFRPLILALKEKNINEIVFLSVQGADTSKFIPHYKIEQLILEFNMDYIFLRPSYFMQNLTTTLLPEIKEKQSITLPSDNANFNWIDIENIGEIAAIMLEQFEEFKNSVYELTGLENKSFHDVAQYMQEILGYSINFIPVSPLRFYTLKKKEGMPSGMILVMIMLHFLPRFQKDPSISNVYESLTGKKPTDLKSFILREKHRFN